MITCVFLGMQNPYLNFGNKTVFSLMLMLSTVCYAIFSLIAIYNTVKTPIKKVNKLAYSYHATCSVIHLLAFSYLLYFGIIGVRVWA